MEQQNTRVRYPFLDELRGFAVFCMVIYHALYSLYFVFDLPWAGKLLYFFMPVEPLFAALFIWLCGFCTMFSRNSLKRGLLIAAAAVAVSAVTLLMTLFDVHEEILFGVLFLLASGTLLYAVSKKFIAKCNPKAGAIANTVLFCATYLVPQGYLGFGPLSVALPEALYSTKWLAFLGLPGAGFHSADYFPLVPWVFIFFFGVFASKMFKNRILPSSLQKSRCKPLAFLGKKALCIYLLHQPLIFGLAWLVQAIVG